ncbi:MULTISPECIES: glycoside hydrolase family 6 protein [unclassified Lysobacter]|uniref:glycoside hydrolase family 6 protein n=1 Tax=unclassified Lysobacter TaxID=2635362 RepID=UPI001BE8ABF8|nr:MULTISPECIES: glycoside hydrolase family 6 protein [unclassified Lysobacter]MBT2745840.1 glycoside hydrolase family 6 protein [Lysobacter sp. ISL-42]MBT2749601.1 glycoside hydrolase family 6 protein [Lysobacter sp. ISL-50]MBT2778755.1 glycoside hydrolase family 6 protein [Lysobacter sp. ISL-54]MBT2781350.1 glycoside hydrolase family 6 protein [Lysobacter sp. ISL-52]
MRQTNKAVASKARNHSRDRVAPAALLLAVAAVFGSGSAMAANQNSGFYVDPDSNPAVWVRDHASDSRAGKIKTSIATKPMARWFGNWSGSIGNAVSRFVEAARAADKLPILVAYNITSRDCGSHSGGGAGSAEAYRTWISSFASGIGNRRAVVVIEPDALAQLDCLASDQRAVRIGLLQYAAREFKLRAPNAQVYHDGGNAGWIAADEMARRLNSAGVGEIRGFALNVSNYKTTADSNAYGASVKAQLKSQFGYEKPFVVDTSRNGNGSNGEWCNPAGRKLGVVSQNAASGAEMLLWVKVPGDSDGPCGIAPNTPAGTFSPDIATRLIDGR